jgi:hypothetical protein
VQGAKDVVSNIAGKVKTNVPVRAAQLTDQKLAAQAQSLHDVVTAIQGKTNVAPDAVKTALTKIKGKQGPGDKLTDHPEVQKSISALVKNVGDKKGLTDKERGALHTEITNHVEAGTPGVPQGVQDALKRPAVASTPSPAVRGACLLADLGHSGPRRAEGSGHDAGRQAPGRVRQPDEGRPGWPHRQRAVPPGERPERLARSGRQAGSGLRQPEGSRDPFAPVRHRYGNPRAGIQLQVEQGAAPAHVQHVLATVARTAPGSALSKNHLTAYDKLTKA